MPLITSATPERWEELEELVTAILHEAGMTAKRQVTLDLPRGDVDVDVYAEEKVDGIVHRTVCECKNWKTNIPKDVVHAFRTVMQETGANRGYIISRMGFQSGAVEAAKATNINLVTFEEFQQRYFDKWYKNRCWTIENVVGNFNTYYEPIGTPGYHLLQSDGERAAYDEVLNRYLFAGIMLTPFSPYLGIFDKRVPTVPFDFAKMDKQGVSTDGSRRSRQTWFWIIVEFQSHKSSQFHPVWRANLRLRSSTQRKCRGGWCCPSVSRTPTSVRKPAFWGGS